MKAAWGMTYSRISNSMVRSFYAKETRFRTRKYVHWYIIRGFLPDLILVSFLLLFFSYFFLDERRQCI